MDWPTLVENFYSNFQKYKIGIISDEDELEELKAKIIEFKK